MPIAKIELRKLHSGQQEIYNSIINNRYRRVVLRCGRRFGKTELLETACARFAISNMKIGWFTPAITHYRPTFDRLERLLYPLKEKFNRSDKTLRLKGGGLIEFWSLDDPDAGRSRSYHKAIIDEAQGKQKGLIDIYNKAIAPTLLDTRGDTIAAGTPLGIDKNSFFYNICTDKSKGWIEYKATSFNNPFIHPDEQEQIKQKFPPLVYQQEYLAEFVDWSGSAFFSLLSL
jgi:hypothetical protein